MNINKASTESHQFALLSQAILNLEPGTLDALSPDDGPTTGNARAGMNEFIRRMLLRAMSLLHALDDYMLQLYTEDASVVPGYNTRIHNLVELFAWALIRLPRRVRRRGELALCLADADIVVPVEQRRSVLTTDRLVRATTAIVKPHYDAIRDASGPQNCSVSFCELIVAMLDIKPESLIRLYYEAPAAAEQAFERDPEGQAVAGLSAMLTRTLFHQQILTEIADDCVLAFKIYVDDKDAGPDGAAGSNLAALITAGYFAGDKRRVGFIG